jgi:hypothetical protein
MVYTLRLEEKNAIDKKVKKFLNDKIKRIIKHRKEREKKERENLGNEDQSQSDYFQTNTGINIMADELTDYIQGNTGDYQEVNLDQSSGGKL